MNRNNYDLRKKIGRRIKTIRDEIGLQQYEMAEQLNIANSSLCAIEKGNTLPSFEFIKKLLHIYNINLYYIFDGTGKIFSTENHVHDQPGDITADQIDFLNEFLDLYKKSELVRYSFQAYFQQFKLEKDNLIQLDIKRKEPGG